MGMTSSAIAGTVCEMSDASVDLRATVMVLEAAPRS